jgi:aminopeptidase YwaD
MTELSIYPNPAKEVLTIETDRSGLYTIEITTLSGQLLYSAKMVGPVIQLNLSSFQKGLYFLTIRSRNYVRTEKIVKM